jgi:hypothetical protein
MARAWRIEYEGALYHVLSRGNEKQDIVINDDDRTLFLIRHRNPRPLGVVRDNRLCL